MDKKLTTEPRRSYKNLGRRDLRCANCKTWIKRGVGRYGRKFVISTNPHGNVRQRAKIHCESCLA